MYALCLQYIQTATITMAAMAGIKMIRYRLVSLAVLSPFLDSKPVVVVKDVSIVVDSMPTDKVSIVIISGALDGVDDKIVYNVGSKDGLIVGNEDGSIVVLLEGVSVVGSSESYDGSDVGISDGSMVGWIVGFLDGDFVGSLVGKSVGAGVKPILHGAGLSLQLTPLFAIVLVQQLSLPPGSWPHPEPPHAPHFVGQQVLFSVPIIP